VAGTVGTHPEGGLAGRSAEVDQLRSAVRQVAGGTGRTLVVVGEAGIGKTRVVDAGLGDADQLGVWVFEGAADELEQRRPFGVIADCLATGRSATERERAAVTGLLGEDSGADVFGGWLADAPQAEFQIVEGFVALVEAFSVQNPVVLVVEDLQWADPSALLVLHRLARRVGQLPLLLVCTVRPVPRSAELEGCLRGLRAAGATELVLGRSMPWPWPG
jgi:predicted ATPase